jgi:hypothetical protein
MTMNTLKCPLCQQSLPCPTTKPKEVEVERIPLSAAEILAAFESSGYVNDILHALGFTMEKPKVKVSCYLNVYPRGRIGDPHDSRAEADVAADQGRIACIHIEREVTEGEGIE